MQFPSYILGQVHCQWWRTTMSWIPQHVVDRKTNSYKICVYIISRCLRADLGYKFYVSLLLATMVLASVYPWCQTQSISSKLTSTVLTGAASSWGLMSPNSAPKISIIISVLQQQTQSLLTPLLLTESHNMRPLMCYTVKSPCPQKINVPAFLCRAVFNITFLEMQNYICIN